MIIKYFSIIVNEWPTNANFKRAKINKPCKKVLLNSKEMNKNILVRKLVINKKFKEPNTYGKFECKCFFWIITIN
jgi:hypothetical protein